MESYHVAPQGVTCKEDPAQFGSERKEVSTEWVEFDDFNYDDEIRDYESSEPSTANVPEKISLNRAYGYAMRTELITQVQDHKCLWDYRTNDYRVQDSKARAWEMVRCSMKSKGFDYEVINLKRQWKSLKDTWRKMKQKAGPGGRMLWTYTKQMRFLEEVEFIEGRYPNYVNAYPSPSARAETNTLKRKAPALDEGVQNAPDSDAKRTNLSPPLQAHDQFSAFGQMVAEVLRSLPMESAKSKMHIISTTLFASGGTAPSNGC